MGLLAEEQIDTAIREFQRAVKLKPGFPQAHINLSNALVRKGDAPGAILESREAVRLAPADSEAHRTLAHALDSSGETEAAAEEMRRGIDREAARADLHDELGSLLVRAARAKEGKAEFAEALRLQPDLGSAHLHLGVLRLQEKAFDEAIVHLQAAVSLDAGSAQAHYYLGEALREKNDPSAALRELQTAVKLQPDFAEAQNAVGLLLQHTGNADEAVAAFRVVARLQPENADGHNNLGLALLQLGDADHSILEFQAALRLRPQDTGYRANLGVAYLQKADFDSAVEQFESALSRAPKDATLHYDLGLALKLKDKLTEAVGEFRKAEELDPQLADVHYTLGVTLWQQGEFAPAADELQAATDAKPDYAEAFYTLGTVLKQQGKLPQAADALRQAIHLQPNFAGAHTTLAAVLRQLGDNEGAAVESKVGTEIGKAQPADSSSPFQFQYPLWIQLRLPRCRRVGEAPPPEWCARRQNWAASGSPAARHPPLGVICPAASEQFRACKRPRRSPALRQLLPAARQPPVRTRPAATTLRRACSARRPVADPILPPCETHQQLRLVCLSVLGPGPSRNVTSRPSGLSTVQIQIVQPPSRNLLFGDKRHPNSPGIRCPGGAGGAQLETLEWNGRHPQVEAMPNLNCCARRRSPAVIAPPRGTQPLLHPHFRCVVVEVPRRFAPLQNRVGVSPPFAALGGQHSDRFSLGVLLQGSSVLGRFPHPERRPPADVQSLRRKPFPAGEARRDAGVRIRDRAAIEALRRIPPYLLSPAPPSLAESPVRRANLPASLPDRSPDASLPRRLPFLRKNPRRAPACDVLRNPLALTGQPLAIQELHRVRHLCVPARSRD